MSQSNLDFPQCIKGAYNDDIQDFVTLFGNAGWLSGGDITDNGDGTINITAGTGVIRESNSGTANLRFFDWAASNNIAFYLKNYKN